MILRTEEVEQAIDGDLRATLIKDVVMTPGKPLGMVRKRLPPPHVPRAPVLLIHGFAQNRYTWHTSRRSLSAFLASAGYDVFNADLRGHGRSRRFAEGRSRTLDEYILHDVPACAEEAMRLSGHDRIFLVGHSMGGLVSYGAAATSLRGRTRGVITIGTPYRFGVGSWTLNALATMLSAVRATGIVDSNPALPLRRVGHHLRKRRALWDNPIVPVPLRAWSPGSTEAEVLDEYLRLAFDWTSAAIVYDILRSGRKGLSSFDGQRDYAMAFEHLDVPLLIIAGTADSLAPPSSVEPAYRASRSRDRTWRVFPLGHIDLIVGREAPGTVWHQVRTWLEHR